MPEAAYLVLVMLVNHRNISILDEKAMKARGWKLSDPYGLQYTPLGRACGLCCLKEKKRKKKKNNPKLNKERNMWKVTFYVGNQSGGLCSLELISYACSAPKLVTQLLIEGVCTGSHGHPHRKANCELFPCPPHINLYKGNYCGLMEYLLSICGFSVSFQQGKRRTGNLLYENHLKLFKVFFAPGV